MRLITIPLFLAASMPAFAAPLFIGTNTGGKSESKGIYLADFDAETGKLTKPELVAEYASPGFLAFHPTKKIVYAVGKPNKPTEDKFDSLAAFSFSDGGKKLEFLGEISSSGTSACHLVVDETGRTVAVANYGNGVISTIRLDEKGGLEKIASVIANTGGSVNKSRQEGPHAHGTYFDKANKFLFVPDLGLDKVLTYQFDPATSEIKAHDPASFSVPAGAGARHMAFSPDEKHAYIINELDSTMTAVSYDAGKGAFAEVQTLSTLPEGNTDKNSTAEVEVSENGKFVYGSNRFHDSIVVYARDEKTGKLTWLQDAPAGGKTPRHFKIDPSGKWMLVGHQDSNSISVLPVDPVKGVLGEPVSTISTPSPICIAFLPE